MGGQKVRIITYHYIRNAEESDFPGIKALSINDFEKQIQWINKRGHVITQNDLLQAYQGSNKLPDNSYLLTFDDAYADHIENVFPILQAFNMTGVFFIPIKAVVKREVLDVNKIQFSLGSGNHVTEITRHIFKSLDNYRIKHSLKSDNEYWRICAKPGRFDGPAVKFIKNMLQFELPEAVRADIIDKLFKKYVSNDEMKFANDLYLTIDDIEKLKENNMEIASHGYDHVWLGSLSKKEQLSQIQSSIKHFSKLAIDKDNWTMCYPYGSYNKCTELVLKRHGCNMAYTTKGEETKIKPASRYKINRMDTNELMIEMKETTERVGQADISNTKTTA